MAERLSATMMIDDDKDEFGARRDLGEGVPITPDSGQAASKRFGQRGVRYVDLIDESEWAESMALPSVEARLMALMDAANRRLGTLEADEQALYRTAAKRETFFRDYFGRVGRAALQTKELVNLISKVIIASGISVARFRANEDAIMNGLCDLLKQHLEDGN